MSGNNKSLTVGSVEGVLGVLNQMEGEVKRALPKFIRPEQMIRVAITTLRKNPKLLNCNRESFLGAIIQAAQLGLMIDGVSGQAYLVPFKSECQLIVGYKGMIDLARRSGHIKTITAEVVHASDSYEFQLGTEPFIVHKPAWEDPGDFVAAYAIATVKGGEKQFVWMWKREIDKIAKVSKTDKVWKPYYDEMAKKTAIRRLCKYLPASVELQTAIGLEEMHIAGERQNNAALIDADFTVKNGGTASGLDAVADKVESQLEDQPGDDEAFSQEDAERMEKEEAGKF